jgi:hypothetical protein
MQTFFAIVKPTKYLATFKIAVAVDRTADTIVYVFIIAIPQC